MINANDIPGDLEVQSIIISALTKEVIHEESCANKPEQTTCVKEELLILVVSLKIKYMMQVNILGCNSYENIF